MDDASLLDDIDAAVADAVAVRRETWFDRLPAKVRSKFVAARKKFHAGGYGNLRRSTLGRVLIGYGQQHGCQTCDYKRMSEWLAKKP